MRVVNCVPLNFVGWRAICRETICVVSPMVSRQHEFSPSIRVECPSCGFFSPVTLRFSEAGTADYEGICECELEGGGMCGAALLVTVTLSEEAEEIEGA